MAERLNDTDPQSPRALGGRTDPGLGEAPLLGSAPAPTVPSNPPAAEISPIPPAVRTPAPASASIDELLVGITGPRPPTSRREGASTPPPPVATDGARAYAAARPAPASQPMPPQEAVVISPSPSNASEPPARPPEPDSTRPIIRLAEERTVYTGRRALVRNLVVVIASAAVVALMMTSIMRWKEAQRAHGPSDVVVAAPVLEPEAPAASAPVEPALAVIQAASMAAVQPTVTAPALGASAHLAATPPKHLAKPPAPSKPAAPRTEGLDDLNREIRH
ncbi:MAG TPA: hypothetical protein VGI39_30220 [Polyangiaceae bacterium]|jgi:hypothetical protein